MNIKDNSFTDQDIYLPTTEIPKLHSTLHTKYTILN